MVSSRRRYLLAMLASGALPPAIGAAPQPRSNALEDFDAFWHAVDEGYAYFEPGHAAWKRARELWRPRAARAASRDALLAAFEGASALLCDDHVTLSEASSAAPRLVPQESDLWAAWKGGNAVLEAVRTYGDADVAGLRPGHVVTRIDGAPVERVVRERLAGVSRPTPAARDWALRHALAGPRLGSLRIEVAEGGHPRNVVIERQPASRGNGPALIGRRMGEDRELGYIRIRPGLAGATLLAEFETALVAVRDTRALMLDLREVHGDAGREPTRAILARFAPEQRPWQVREGRSRERVTDIVAPEGPVSYRSPVAVLVDRWTAGEGEALASGMHALGARLVGTRMAGMRGELRRVTLPHSGIVASFPAEKVFHVDGTPREALRPTVEIDLAAPSGGPGDPILYQALKLLAK
jgi:carboxyl-terminal processing protease